MSIFLLARNTFQKIVNVLLGLPYKLMTLFLLINASESKSNNSTSIQGWQLYPLGYLLDSTLNLINNINNKYY